jgi:hypothetical protein
MVPMLLPLLWVLRAADAGAPPNVCVDACETLRWGYAQLGIRAELHVTTITAGKTLPPGTQFPLRRGSSTLLCTTTSEAADHVVTGNPWMLRRPPDHQRAGRNLAA